MKGIIYAAMIVLLVWSATATVLRIDSGYNETFIKEMVDAVPKNVTISMIYFHNYCRYDLMGFSWWRQRRIDIWLCGEGQKIEGVVTQVFFHEVGHLAAFENDEWDSRSEREAWYHDNLIGHSLTNERIKSIFLNNTGENYGSLD